MDKGSRKIRYYIRLTNLIDVSLDKDDEGMVSIKSGAELSYLNVPSQSMVNDYIEKELCTVSETQAKEIKELYIKKQLSDYELHKILCCETEKEKFIWKLRNSKVIFQVIIQCNNAKKKSGRYLMSGLRKQNYCKYSVSKY